MYETRLAVNEERGDKVFVQRWLMGRPVREHIQGAAKETTSTMKKISRGIVMAIPFPPKLSFENQRQIVTYLEERRRKVDEVKKLQAETATELDALMPSILSKAFSGDL